MAYHFDGQGPYYSYYPWPSFEAPVTFHEPNAYIDDDNYRRNYRLHNLGTSRSGLEQVYPRQGAEAPPWRSHSDYPYSASVSLQDYRQYPWQYHDTQDQFGRPYHSTPETVEMYAPICCEECERKVRSHLEEFEGVESVSADQWEKKVVVKGYNLHPHFLLRRLQRDKPTSVFWCDRPS